jgi:hypothetical protein
MSISHGVGGTLGHGMIDTGKILPMLRVLYGNKFSVIPCQSMVLLIALMSLLVASLVSFLVFVFLEVPLLGVVLVMLTVILPFAHTLLVRLVFRIILIVSLVL